LMSVIVYIPYKTPILDEEESKGNNIYNGLYMFVYHGAESFKIWTNKDADINSIKTAVLQQLKGE
ncbi:shikimate dehydrogenase, partial [Staphylococcus aureus]|nr:shikimate dehydrogenase [Staphylococcus aureus]